MRNRVLKTVAISACMLTVTVGFTSTTQAGLIPWLYDAIFGPVRPGYGAGYYGAGYFGGYPATYGVGYAPLISPAYSPCGPAGCPTTVGYAPACSPCVAAYDPCAGGACPGGNCFVPPATTTSTPIGGPAPTPADGPLPAYEGPPRTFGPSEPPLPPADQQSPMNDEGFYPRQPANEPETGPESIEAFDFPNEAIPERQPAPMNLPDDGAAAPNSEENRNEASADDVNLNGGPGLFRLPAPQFDLEDKITWRVVPERTRLAVRAHFEAPVVVRSRVDVNADWTPVPTETKVVSK